MPVVSLFSPDCAASPGESPAGASARSPAPPSPAAAQQRRPEPAPPIGPCPPYGPGTPPSVSNRAGLHAAIAAIERGSAKPGGHGAECVSTGLDVLDAALPWGGLPRAMVHEIAAPEASAAGLGFALHLAAAFSAADGRPALVSGHIGDLYAPGLAAFGLDPARLVLARARDADTLAWVLEQAAESAAPAVALGVLGPRARPLGGAQGVALRRLQLAAERGGVAVLLVRTDSGPADARAEARGPVATRWRVTPASCQGPVPALNSAPIPALNSAPIPALNSAPIPATSCWRLDLVRCRGGRPGRWTVSPTREDFGYDSALHRGPAARRLALVSEPGDGPPAPRARPRLDQAAG